MTAIDGDPAVSTGSPEPAGPALATPLTLRGHVAPSRVLFGPHETNLARRRDISDRHVAYYARRAAGGAGVIVTETASVTADDWPYERAPLAADCGPGWAALAAAVRPYGTVVLAGLGHAGGQGSSAYSQAVLWAPSPVADAASRELPAELEQDGIDAIVAGFAAGASLAVEAGLAGVEIDAGPLALLRQFHSGLTNHRGDGYADRLRLTREVLTAVRAAIGPEKVLALRLSCDELAPWAGVTPEQAAEQVDALAGLGLLDLLVVVRGGPYSTAAYRPTAHTAPTFNRDLCAAIRATAAGRVAVALQGSVVDAGDAEAALADGVADLVEMTRAQIADPELVTKVRAGAAERVRPCLLCNQACRVRDNRNPIVSCVGEPRSGHETEDAPVEGSDPRPRAVLVVGGGPAGLEAARVLASRGHTVTLAEAGEQLGGTLRTSAVGPGRERLARLVDWQEAECARLGVTVELGRTVTAAELDAAEAAGQAVILATGSVAAGREYPATADAFAPQVVDALSLLAAGPDLLVAGPVVLHDPVGGPVAVGIAEWLAAAGREVALVAPDQVAGTLLSLTGDLAPANTRLAQAGVRRELRALVREIGDGHVVLEDVWTGARREIPCAALVDCGHRLPDEALYLARPGTPRAGDCVAPRTALEAVLEGRRRALELARRAPARVSPLVAAGTGGTR
ncbi:mycofactocin system FadH/OYE family oxidoreductase 1 [Frankia sp. AgB1.9]|uniref:mycofactocin system FadH/OYE family oxidoreductase 1 n=1 Tax=unclassified Frankia TaxID=2632575 RepID=UPI0019346EFB|nr:MULTISPECIES: mycofactocin system FadH/OYE family oxidoreductase 1 [unclassified Frankia]MBL7492250.1 mycofactocin system FadH/OYE family oxidoreductase 1 [Frankia sp. AgW1.1]MBL7550074.1 mycofactocin system FadH/OYE family oxidoreductase 1 [Frankia sp. AgB1.9]MBL7621182.1 mycofactocin system FadH/OYE family oxidoreductase 1 [Frankia sp. AgB1.8]